MSSAPYRHRINLVRGVKLIFTWQGEEDGVNHDWSAAVVSCKLIDTADSSAVATITPTVGTSGDNDEIITAVFSVDDTSAYPIGVLKGDIEVTGTALGTQTPVIVYIYVTADTTN